MPFDGTKLAYVSNDTGKGDLNCLAHVLVAYIKSGSKKLSVETILQLYSRYNANRFKQGYPVLKDPDEFLKIINAMTPLDVEKEITPILEELFDKKPSKPHLNRFVELANYLGLKVEAHVRKRASQKDADVARSCYANFIPSKRANQTALPTQTAITKGTIDIIDTLGIKQTGLDPDALTVKLFLEDPNNSSVGFNCHFEYPVSDFTTDTSFRSHNECMEKENRKRKASLPNTQTDEPLSFGQSISMMVGMLGGIFAKFMDVCLVAFKGFQQMSAGTPGHKKTSQMWDSSSTFLPTKKPKATNVKQRKLSGIADDDMLRSDSPPPFLPSGGGYRRSTPLFSDKEGNKSKNTKLGRSNSFSGGVT